jgi:hypothetical protein
MELKDVILSTLAEMEDLPAEQPQPFQKKEKIESVVREVEAEITTSTNESEVLFLSSIRERLLVLFEGFQAPNNTNIEAKVDLTLNFLEYVLGTIDSRIEKLEKGDKK